jgi:hypothetical protein
MSKPGRKVAKTAQEREAEARQEKLAHVEEQVKSGSLVIREMTAAERAKWAKRRAVRVDAGTPAERAARAAAAKRAKGRQPST